MEPEVVGESDSEVEGEAWHVEREDTSEEEEEEVDDEVCAGERAKFGVWHWIAPLSKYWRFAGAATMSPAEFRNVWEYFCSVSRSPVF